MVEFGSLGLGIYRFSTSILPETIRSKPGWRVILMEGLDEAL